MSFQSYLPCAALRPYVRSLAVQTATEAQVYRVLPTLGLVVGFQFCGRLAHQVGNTRLALAPVGVTGICTQSRLFANESLTASVLVLFREGGAAPFFRLPLHELFQQSVALDCLVPSAQLAQLREALDAAATDAERIQLVERFLLRLYQPASSDRLVQGALAALHHSHGTLRMATLARQLGTSSSPLEKRFRQVVGTSPKKAAAILQLTHALAQHRPGQSLTELSYLAGFYDQAHFIHAFQAFTGQPPGKYFAANSAATVETATEIASKIEKTARKKARHLTAPGFS